MHSTLSCICVWPEKTSVTTPPGGSAAGLDLSGMELSGDLSGIDFRKAILGGWDPEDEDEDFEPTQTAAFNRVLQRAVFHVQSSGGAHSKRLASSPALIRSIQLGIFHGEPPFKAKS